MAPISSDTPLDSSQSPILEHQQEHSNNNDITSIQNGTHKIEKNKVKASEATNGDSSATITLGDQTLDALSVSSKQLTKEEEEEREEGDGIKKDEHNTDTVVPSGALDKQQQAEQDKQQTESESGPLDTNTNAVAPVSVTSDVNGVQRTNSFQNGHSGMIFITKPKLKRPPLRPIDPNCHPKKSILKKESSYPFIEQPVRSPIFKSQWLQSTVNKLAVMSGPAPPTAYTANTPSIFRKLVTQATAATSATSQPPVSNTSRSPRPIGPPVFANSERSLSILDSSNGSSTSLLSDKSLKRVRFSVGQLNTEHVFHNDDAYESEEETDPQKGSAQPITPPPPKKFLVTSDGVVVDDNIYTAKEIMNYYIMACADREDAPIDRLINEMHDASSRTSNPLLTSIDISDEPLTKRALDPICDILSLEFGLKHLYLDNCSFEDDTLKMLLYSLLLTDTLTVLSIQDNKKIKTNGFKYISVYVKKTKSLKSLNISGNIVDKKSVEFLSHALRVGRLGFGSRVEELRMDRCGLRGNLLEIMAPAFRESNLKLLSLRSNRIGSAGGVWLGVVMRDYEDQPNSNIPVNNEEQGFKRVFPGASSNELLKRHHGIGALDISDNDLRQGMDYVAQTLRRNRSLKSLVMTNNNLDPARLVILADALKLNTGLESLDISGNRVCGPVDAGIVALKQKLTYNRTLLKLSLSNTGLQSDGAIVLAEYLPETRTLTQLDLTGNDLVDIAGVMALSAGIRINKSITCLDMNVPPNDAEFARLSRDILRACIRNMEEKTGSNEGMPSPDDEMTSSTIFRQPTSPTTIPELASTITTSSSSPSEDKRWRTLEAVAGELYRTREILTSMEKALNHEKAMRRSWLDHFYSKASAARMDIVEESEQSDDHPEGAPVKISTVPVPSTPEEQKMFEVANGTLYHAPPQIEVLYRQCKRQQAVINTFIPLVDNHRALQELDNMGGLLVVFMDTYRGLFALPDMPENFIVSKRTNSLPPLEPVNGSSSSSSSQSSTENKIETMPNGDVSTNNDTTQEQQIQRSQSPQQVVPEVITEEPASESTFLLEDDDDVDDEVFTNDELNDVRRSSLISDRRSGSGSSSPSPTPEDQSPESSTMTSPTYRGRGLKPTPVNTTAVTGDVTRLDAEKSPSSLASPLEKLRKVTEMEEAEAMRRGKDLLENELAADELLVVEEQDN